MKISHPAIKVLAWIAKCSSSDVIHLPPPLPLTHHQTKPPLTSHCASVTINPLKEDEEDEAFKHLRETAASEKLRLLVSELRREEAARHQMRRREKSKESEIRINCISGLVPIIKPSGITSTDVCRVVRYLLRNTQTSLSQHLNEDLNVTLHANTSENKNQQRRLRVGHGGTLDPAASGVLVLGINRGTVALQSLLNGSKEYVARIRLGTETDTLDAEGMETRQAPWEHINLPFLNEVISSFQGEYAQQPPLFSAKKVRGRQLYKAARERSLLSPEDLPAPCQVKIENIKLHPNPNVKLPDFDVFVRCSKGTYIRQLAADIAKAAGSVGHVRMLVRTRQGPFGMEDCVSLEGLNGDGLFKHIIPLDAMKVK